MRFRWHENAYFYCAFRANWRLRFSLPSIILADLLGSNFAKTGSKGYGLWSVIRFCVSISRFVACDRNYDWRQQKTQLWRRLLNFRVRVFVKSAVKTLLCWQGLNNSNWLNSVYETKWIRIMKKKMPFILSRVRVWRLRRRPHFPNFPQLCGAVIHDMNTWLPLSLTWQDYCTFNLQLVTIKGVDWDNSPYVFGQSEKRNWVQCIITRPGGTGDS